MLLRRPPASPLAASTLVTTSGDGLYIAGSALFFTRTLHFAVAEVGLGLTFAGLLGLGAGVPLGRLADRRSPRDLLIGIQLVQAAAIGAYVFADRSLPAFVALATIVIACMQGSDAAKGALVGKLAREDPVRMRALLHSVSNIGIAIGTVLAGFAIARGTPGAYRLLMLADAGSFVAAAALLLALPRESGAPPVRLSQRRRWVALRDGPFVALTAANCAMSVQYFVLAFAMPLWVIGHTAAPRWLVSPMLLVNTALIVLLQVRFTHRTKTPRGAARSMLLAGAVLAVSMGLYGSAAHRGALVAVVLLLVAVVAHSLGELMQSAGAFGISYGLAEQSALGEYLGVYGLGLGVCRAVAPAILAATCLSHALAGWAALAGMFVLSGILIPPLTRWAEGTRNKYAYPSGEHGAAEPTMASR